MKKNFKKLLILILTVITCFVTVTTTYAETALSTFKATYNKINTPITFPGNFHVIKTTDGKHVFCLQYNKQVPGSNVVYTKGDLITDNGMNYILAQAYNSKTDNDHFIYKSALWLYMIDMGLMEGTYNGVKTYYTNVKNSNTTEAKKILELVANAKKASANDTSAPTIKINTGANTFSLDSNGKYYVSNNITVTSSTGSYEVSLTSAPSGSTIEKNGNTIVIKVPADKVTNLETTIGFKVSNTKDIYTSYKYNPNSSSYQPLAATFKETKTASANASLVLKRTASVSFLKVDAETGKALSGAELKLVNSKGEVIKTWTSTDKAQVVTGLSVGEYTLIETKAPEGYKAIETSVKFTIDSTGKVIDAKGNTVSIIKITNERKTGDVSISKQDITNNKELPGATLVVKDSNGNVIEEWVSTNKPHLIKNLTPGVYTLTETIAPEGYVLSEETITFTVKDDGSVTKVVMYNTPKRGNVSISKQDITNKKELPGATLVVKDYDGNVIEEWVSTDKPHYIENLKPGIYTLTETIAPEGYILSDETITFTVKEDGSITKVVMYNTPSSKEEIPVEPTSSFKTMTSSLIGTLIILLGSYLIFKNSKKKEV